MFPVGGAVAELFKGKEFLIDACDSVEVLGTCFSDSGQGFLLPVFFFLLRGCLQGFDSLNEGVHLALLRAPARAEADQGVVFVCLSLDFKDEAILQGSHLRIG